MGGSEENNALTITPCLGSCQLHCQSLVKPLLKCPLFVFWFFADSLAHFGFDAVFLGEYRFGSA